MDGNRSLTQQPLAVESYVRFIVAGGLLSVAGIWMLALFAPGTAAWLLGLLVVTTGGGSLLYGIADPLEL